MSEVILDLRNLFQEPSRFGIFIVMSNSKFVQSSKFFGINDDLSTTFN